MTEKLNNLDLNINRCVDYMQENQENISQVSKDHLES